MRLTTVFALVALLHLTACLGADPATRPATQPAEAPCSLALTVEHASYRVTDQVKVSLVLSNRSPRGTFVTTELTKPRLLVTHDGEVVPRTLYGKWLDHFNEPTTEPRSYNEHAVLVTGDRTHPWQPWEWPLSREYDLSRIGEYHVTVTCEVGDGDRRHKVTVTSNEVVFQIK